MKKIIRVGDTKEDGGKPYGVFVEIDFSNGRLSLSGVEGPLANGNSRGGCGQIDLASIRFESYGPGFSADIVTTLAAIWAKFHLNDLQAGCEHQRALGWGYTNYPLSTKTCPICGYPCGSKWMAETVPQWAIDWLFALPDTDVIPAWV